MKRELNMICIVCFDLHKNAKTNKKFCEVFNLTDENISVNHKLKDNNIKKCS